VNVDVVSTSADRARAYQRAVRVNWLVDMWQRDRVGFDLFAAEFIQDDRFIAFLLPKDAAARAEELVRRQGGL
jgi:hypothetical protein